MLNKVKIKFKFVFTFFIIIIGLFFMKSESHAKVYRCEVDAGKRTGIVHKELFGTNIEWFNNANGIWCNKNIDSDFVELARDQGISLVRFPGGTQSDFYHWQDGTGKQLSRPVSSHHTDLGSSKNSFGSPELIKFCKMIGAKPFITVNAGTGTPEEAAGWVAYMNADDNKRRKNDGFSEPFGVKLWEIGNELYLAGSEAEKKITVTPYEYAEKFLSYAEKMQSVDPSISLVAIGVAGSYIIPFGPYKDWNKIVLSNAGDKIDYISLHNAYFPVLYEKKKYNKRKVYQSLWGSALAVDKDILTVEKLITKYCKNNKPGIAVTEWGPFFSIYDPEWTDHVKTMGSAVFVARIFQVFMSHPMVKIATYFKFTDNTFMGWVSYNKVPKIPYYVVKMYSNHFGTRLINSKIETPHFNTEKIGFARLQTKVPILNVISSLNESEDKLFINIVSCSWDKEMKIKLMIKNFNIADMEKAIVWTVSGSSPLSYNGKDLPECWFVKAVEPSEQSENISIKKTHIDCSKTIVIPPASVVMIEISSRQINS